MADPLPQKVGEKRANDHEVEGGGKPKEQKLDLVDGQINMMDEAGPFAILSIGESYDGVFLKAEEYGNARRLGLNVNCKGTDYDDPATVFSVFKTKIDGSNDDVKAYFLRYSQNDDKQFYLAAEEDREVLLQKLVNPPQDPKYFFCIEWINPNLGYESPVTFKSLRYGEYLHCSGDKSRVFMKKVTIENGEEHPQDRETWFKLLPRNQPQEELICFQEEKARFAQMETGLDSEDGGNEKSTKKPEKKCLSELNDADKRNSESLLKSSSDTLQKNGDGNSTEENFKEVENADRQVNNSLKITGEANSEDPKMNNSTEQVMIPPPDPGEGNSKELEDGNSGCSEEISVG